MRAVALVEGFDGVEIDSDVTSLAHNNRMHAKTNSLSRSTVALISKKSQRVTVRPTPESLLVATSLGPEDLPSLHNLQIMRVRITIESWNSLVKIRKRRSPL